MYPDMTRPSRFHSPLAGSRAVHKEVRKRKPRSCRLYLHVSSNYTTKRHRTDRNRDTQTTERRHEHTEQATGQVRGHTHHSPLRLPTLTQRLNRPLTGPPSPGQPGRQRNPEPQRRPHAQAPAHHHARVPPRPMHAVHPTQPSSPPPAGCSAVGVAQAPMPAQRHLQ